MCKVIAVANQKGGVGKTVTSVNLGIGLAREGKKVLMIDADPQGSLSISLGFDEPDKLDTDTFPEKDGETNFNREIGMPYAKVEEGIAVLYEK